MLTKRTAAAAAAAVAGPLSEDVRELILGYLSEHPHAADTLEGIVEWWIERQRLRLAISTVSSALKSLLEEDLLEQVGVGSGCRYRLKANLLEPNEHSQHPRS